MFSSPAIAASASILIVDDSPDNLRILSDTLVAHQYKVRCVTTGAMAIKSATALPPDLILLDVCMPVMDGYEACRQLKAHPVTQQIPVVFISAMDDGPGKVNAFKVGGADYITKPFHTEEVIARIEHQLTIQRLQEKLLQQNQQLKTEIYKHQQTEEVLRQEIHNRTLIETALKDAKDVAEVANQAKNEFLANMSHELRTPLNAILGFAGLIATDTTISEDCQGYATIIRSSGERLLTLINNILTVTSLEARTLPLHQQCFDFHQFLATCQSVWETKTRAKGLQLIMQSTAELPQWVEADESKLYQVLFNLLSNAVQFTSQGQITLRIGAESVSTQPSPASYTLHFQIEDTGPGIADHEIPRLFQQFSKTETGRQSERGIGLGLLISHQFVQLMGGELAIASTPGQGTLAQFHIQVQGLEAPPDLWPTAQPRHPGGSDQLPSVALTEPEPTPPLSILEIQALMPTCWLGELHQAALKGSDQHILRLLQEIPPTHTRLAKQLVDWARNFQFDQILDLTQSMVSSPQ